jgi:hypothetical protein
MLLQPTHSPPVHTHARSAKRQKKQFEERLRRDRKEQERELQERLQRTAVPRNDEGPLPRIY